MKKQAFTIIEVMIILVITSITVLATIPLLTGKSYTPKWKVNTNAGDTYITYGQDNSTSDRVGVFVDPYNTSQEGKLSVGSLRLEPIPQDTALNSVGKFIFGGLTTTTAGSPNTYALDGVDSATDDIWNNTTKGKDALIIGRNYPDANLSSATIISSFSPTASSSPRSTTDIQGTCIGGNINSDCTDSDSININNKIKIKSNSVSFLDLLKITSNTVSTNNQPLEITGDLFLQNYSVGTSNCSDPTNTICARAYTSTTANNGKECISYNSDGTCNSYIDTTSTDLKTMSSFALTIVTNTHTYRNSSESNSNNDDNNSDNNNDDDDNNPNTESAFPSDIRLKNIISDYTKGITDINKIKTHYYTFKNDIKNTLHAGIIAQEVVGIFDIALDKTSEGFYAYKKSPFLYAMVNSVKSIYNEQENILKEQNELLKKVKS